MQRCDAQRAQSVQPCKLQRFFASFNNPTPLLNSVFCIIYKLLFLQNVKISILGSCEFSLKLFNSWI